MREVPVKANGDEKLPPPVMATIRGMKGEVMDITFNRSREHFIHNVAVIKIDNKEYDFAVDELAQVLLNGQKVSDRELT